MYRTIGAGAEQSALSLLLYTYVQNSADSCIGAGTVQTVLSVPLYTYLLTFWAAPKIVMVSMNHAALQYFEGLFWKNHDVVLLHVKCDVQTHGFFLSSGLLSTFFSSSVTIFLKDGNPVN